MRPHLRNILAVVLIALALPACHRPPVEARSVGPDAGSGLPAPGSRARTPSVFLWKIQSATGTVFLLGSIHLANQALYPLDPSIEKAFAESSVLVVEADVSGPNSAQAGQSVMQKGMYSGGETLSRSLSDETSRLLADYLDRRQIPRSMIEPLKPWLAAMTLSLLEFQRLGFDPAYGIDQHFLDLAREQGKPIRELESLEFQIGLLSGFTDKEQELFLAYTIDEADDIESLAGEMVEAWRVGDTATIESFFLRYEDDARMHPILERVLFERNEGMAAKIRDYLGQPETHFVVVGAAHVPGERGILRLLERDGGYRIVQQAATADAEPNTDRADD